MRIGASPYSLVCHSQIWWTLCEYYGCQEQIIFLSVRGHFLQAGYTANVLRSLYYRFIVHRSLQQQHSLSGGATLTTKPSLVVMICLGVGIARTMTDEAQKTDAGTIFEGYHDGHDTVSVNPYTSPRSDSLKESGHKSTVVKRFLRRPCPRPL